MQIKGFDESSPAAAMRARDSEGSSGSRTVAGFAQTSGSAEDSDGLQLSKLSSVLNGLANGASAIRRHVLEAMTAVRRGTYQVDASELSRRIVGEALGPA
jgi:anti-sigma28 factor (negative regulator of flagellin synthesis)